MKTLRYMAMFMLAATMIFASCGKDEPTPGNGGNSDPQPRPQPQLEELVGTSWQADVSNSFTYQSITMNFTMQFTMDFITDTTGEMFTDVTIEIPTMPSANQSRNETTAFNYTFDGTSLAISDESGITDTMPYNATNNTFTMNIPAEAGEAFAELGLTVEDVFGSDKVVFHQTRK